MASNFSPKSLDIKWFGFETQEEADLADALWAEGKKNGMTVNDLKNLVPFVLKMLGNTGDWTK